MPPDPVVARRLLLHLAGVEVQRQVDLGHQPVDIFVGDVTPVLAEMRRNAIRASLRRGMGRAQGVGMPPASRVPDGRDMVDIDAEAEIHGVHATAERRSNANPLPSHGSPRLVGR